LLSELQCSYEYIWILWVKVENKILKRYGLKGGGENNGVLYGGWGYRGVGAALYSYIYNTK